ncbi:MAG: SDR family oxidoreductase [Pseudomonadota bacterium]|nr:MAG: SDR family oxidoreductase [Pseudomonadota bacterium]
MRKVVIIGATSAIARETARLFAAAGDQLLLVARDPQRLGALCDDLIVRGAKAAHSCVLDVNALERHTALVQSTTESLGEIDVLLVAHGTLPDQRGCEASVDETLGELTTNFTSVVSLLTVFAKQFEAQGSGVIAVLSSVAGDRGRQSNYVYGAAKGGVSVFMQGLRNRLAPLGVTVTTIKPGFVDTPMTRDFDKGPLWVGPDVVARGIVKALESNKDVVYLPWFWRWIMLVIRLIPERVFKRMKL